MPIYEYRCTACNRKSSVFFRTLAETETRIPTCAHCDSASLRRLVSSFAFQRPWGENLTWPGEGIDDYDEDDPKSMARWLRRMKQEAGEGFGGEMQGMIDQMEAGEMPDELAGDGDFGDDL